jgi:hypothetical protein
LNNDNVFAQTVREKTKRACALLDNAAAQDYIALTVPGQEATKTEITGMLNTSLAPLGLTILTEAELQMLKMELADLREAAATASQQ